MRSFKKTLLLLTLGFSLFANAQQWGDYTLYSLQNSSAAYLMDTSWKVAKTWTFTNAKTGYSTYLMPGGILWRGVSRSGNSFSGGPICGQVQKVGWDGTILWDFVYSTTDYCTHHDICPMPNGNVLLIAYERKTAAQASLAGSTTSIEMWPEKIVEVKPTGATTGEVVWEWHAWDHLVQNADAGKANYQASIPEHPELLNINYKTTKDWMHGNGIDYNPMLDQISLSSHNLNEWYIIDHSTTSAQAASHTGGNAGKGGDFLYRWGNPAAYGASGTAVLNVTHDAHWIPEGVPNAGYIVGFNNKGVSSSQSSVDQVSPPLNGYNYTKTAGAAFSPSAYTLRHACSGYSSNMGNSQQLPNGNMIVAIATSGKVYEINAAGTALWSKTLTGSIPQAFKYDTCYVNNPAPVIPEITAGNAVLSSSPATTYQWYKNGQQISGAVSQNYTPSENGVYLVRITDDKGCVYSYSKGERVEAFPTTGLSSGNISAEDIIIFPNPSDGVFRFEDTHGTLYSASVFDMSGKQAAAAVNTNMIDLSSLQNGLYYLVLQNAAGQTISKKISLFR